MLGVARESPHPDGSGSHRPRHVTHALKITPYARTLAWTFGAKPNSFVFFTQLYYKYTELRSLGICSPSVEGGHQEIMKEDEVHEYCGPSPVLRVGSGNVNGDKQQHNERFILTAKKPS